MTKGNPRGNRNKSKVGVDLPIEIHSPFEGTIRGEIDKVSHTGFLIRVQKPLLKDEVYRLYFFPRNKDNEMCILIQGRIICPGPYNGNDIGTDIFTKICFFAVDEKERRFLNALYGGTSLTDILC